MKKSHFKVMLLSNLQLDVVRSNSSNVVINIYLDIFKALFSYYSIIAKIVIVPF